MSCHGYCREATTCSKTFFRQFAGKLMFLLCLLALLEPPEINAKLIAICSSTSKMNPNRVAIWFITDFRIVDMGGPPAGIVNIEDQNGYQSNIAFSVGCDFGTSGALATMSTGSYQLQLSSHCVHLTQSSRTIYPTDSKLTCYKHAQSTGDNTMITTQSWAIGVTSETDMNFVNTGSNLLAKSGFPIVMDGRVSGVYSIQLTNTDAILEIPTVSPVSDATKAALGVLPVIQFKYYLELSVSNGGADCSSAPVAPQITNAKTTYADGTPWDINFCSSVPDGFVCPLMCNTGFQKRQILTCESSSWLEYFRCSQLGDQHTGGEICEPPGADNYPGTDSGNGYAISTYFTAPGAGLAGCHIWSAKDSVCRFRCTGGTGYWGYGSLRCTLDAMPHFAGFGDPDCRGESDDQLWPKPTWTASTNFLTDVLPGAVRLSWNSPVLVEISAATHYEFEVVPSDQLICNDLRTHITPDPTRDPPLAYICSGSPHTTIPYFIGTYQIRVRVVNRKGAGAWSDVLILSCDPLMPPIENHWWSTRYDLSECQTVGNGQTCEAKCADDPTTLTTFTCTAGQGGPPTGTLPVCKKRANAPLAVTATPTAPLTLHVTWKDAGLNDCVTDGGTFAAWVVSVAPEGTATWQTTGCDGLTNPCVLQCTLTSLPTHNQLYTVKVQATCSDTDMNSEETSTSAGTVRSLPTPAAVPTINGMATVTSDNTIYFTWAAGTANDCTPIRYEVWLLWPSNTWVVNPSGCEYVTGTSCTLEGLPCGTGFYYAVKQLCSESLADSTFSTALYATTTSATAANCPTAAGDPTSLSITPVSNISLTLAWTAGAGSSACTFNTWLVHLAKRISGKWGDWQQEEGCITTFDRTITTCTAINLRPGTEYRFRVYEECESKQASSKWSVESSSAETQPTRADPPTGVIVENVTHIAADIAWKAPLFNGCIFQRWIVTIVAGNVTDEVDQTPVYFSGCDDLYRKSYTRCSAYGLDSATDFRAKVHVACVNAGNSLHSLPSAKFTTKAIRGGMPFSVSNDSSTATSIVLDWTATQQSMGDCTFAQWLIQVKASDSDSWGIPAGCDQVTAQSTVQCTATVPCQKSWFVRIAAVCTIFDAQTLWKNHWAYADWGSCSQSAEPPVGLTCTSPGPKSIFLSWIPAAFGDCIFSLWEVQVLEEGQSTWAAARGTCSTTTLTVRPGSSCTAEYLKPDTKYMFRVREVCTVAMLTSFWTLSDVTSTAAQRSILPSSRVPEGIAASLPTSLVMVYAEPVEIALNKYSATFWATGCHFAATAATFASQSTDSAKFQEMYTICSAVRDGTATAAQTNTCCGASSQGCQPVCVQQYTWSWLTICPDALEMPNACGCDSTNCTDPDACTGPAADGSATSGSLQLLGSRIVRYTLPSAFTVNGGCKYKVKLPAGMVRTVALPIAFSPDTEWYFSYNPPAPRLVTLNMARSTTTGFTLSATWDEPVGFWCTAGGATGAAEYSGAGAASVVLGGMQPSTAHEARCRAWRPDHPNAMACEQVQEGDKSDSNCVFYSDDGTMADVPISAGITEAPRSGKFCREVNILRGYFRTQPDLNNLLRTLSVTYTRSCPSGALGPSTGAFITPSFDPLASGGTYAFYIDYSGFLEDCGLSAGTDHTVRYVVTINVLKDSQTSVLAWTTGQSESAETETWPASGPSTTIKTFTRACTVTPGAGVAATYTFNGNLLYQTFEIFSVTSTDPADPHALKTDGTSTLAVLIRIDSGSEGTFDPNHVNFYIELGSFVQTTTYGGAITDVPGVAGKKEFTLNIASATGNGVNLPIVLNNQGMKARGNLMVSFAVPIIKKVKKNVDNTWVDWVSWELSTTITVEGINVANFPALSVTSAELRVYNVPAQSSIEWPPMGIKVTAAPCGADAVGDYRMVKPNFPIKDAYEYEIQILCDVSKPVYILSAMGCLCSDGTNYNLWKTAGWPSACGTMTCNVSGTDNPLLCMSTDVTFENINKTIPTDVELTITGSKAALSGPYHLRMPGAVALLSDAAYATAGCDFTKPQWANESSVVGSARICWATTAYKFFEVSGSTATEVGALTCANGYTPNVTSCVPSGDVTEIELSERRAPTTFSATGALLNMCGSSTSTSVGDITCTVPATMSHPLIAQIWARAGSGDTWVVVAESDEWTILEQLFVRKPVITALSQRIHDLDGTGSFDVTGMHFPGNTVGNVVLQLWGTWTQATPEARTDAPTDSLVYQPLCAALTWTSSTSATCNRGGAWNGSVLRTNSPVVYMQIGPNVFSMEPLADQISITRLNITRVTTSDIYEVGPVSITVNGNAGDTPSGPLDIRFHYNDTFNISTYSINTTLSEEEIQARRLTNSSSSTEVCRRRRRSSCVEPPQNITVAQAYTGNITWCVVTTRNATSFTCQVNSTASMFGSPLPELDYTHVEAPARTYQIAANIRYFGMGDNDSSSFNFSASFWNCEPGNYRASRENRTCVLCELGKSKAETNAFLECAFCPYGRYADETGMPECKRCAVGETTNVSGAISQTQCECMEGFYREVNMTDCQPCPQNAYCQGTTYIPVATPGHWSPDGRKFWTCYPRSACLHGSNDSYNICEEGRDQASTRCVECLQEHYRYRSSCYSCTQVDHYLSMAAPGVVLVVSIIMIVATLAWHRRGVTVETVIETQHENRVRLRKKNKCWHKFTPRAIFQCIFPPRCWPRIIREMAAESMVRMFCLALGRMQLLWAMGLMPVKWSQELQAQQFFLSTFVADTEVMRFGCLLSSMNLEDAMATLVAGYSNTLQGNIYISSQFVQFLTPYIIILFLSLSICIASCWIRDEMSPNYIHGKGALLSCVSFLSFLTLVKHFADDLWFVACTDCEDDQQCSMGYPLIYCSFDDRGWSILALAACIDLFCIVIPMLCILLLSIYMSWCWQHGAGSGVDDHGNSPWHLEISEFWVKDYKGYSHILREEAVHLREHMKEAKEHNISLHDLWERCIHMVKISRWKVTEKDVESKIFGMCANIEKARSMADARAMAPKTKSKVRNCMAWCRHRRQIRAVKREKQHDIHKLTHALSHCQEFIRETEFGFSIGYESLFWTYSWEFTQLMQRLAIVILAMTANEELAEETLAACLFFQLIVMVGEVDMEPQEWNVLNEINLFMDVLTVYTIIFVQLEWPTWQGIMSWSINVITIAPIVLRMFVPSLQADQELDEDGNVIKKGECKFHMVDMATYQEVLGPAGMARICRLQKRFKKRLRKKKAADPTYVPPLAQDRRPSSMIEKDSSDSRKAEKKKDTTGVSAPPAVDKKALKMRLENVDKMLKAPVESVLKFGWEGIKWPSDFTAVHLAASQGCHESIDILFLCKADLEKQDEWGRTPLDYAKQNDKKLAIQILERLVGVQQRSKAEEKKRPGKNPEGNDLENSNPAEAESNATAANSNAAEVKSNTAAGSAGKAGVQALSAMETVYGHAHLNQSDATGDEEQGNQHHLKSDLRAAARMEGLATRAKKRPPRLRETSSAGAGDQFRATSSTGDRVMATDSDASPRPDGQPRRRTNLRSKGRDKARMSDEAPHDNTLSLPVTQPRRSSSSRARSKSASSRRHLKAAAEVVMF